jgi:hypothetical protein
MESICGYVQFQCSWARKLKLVISGFAKLPGSEQDFFEVRVANEMNGDYF